MKKILIVFSLVLFLASALGENRDKRQVQTFQYAEQSSSSFPGNRQSSSIKKAVYNFGQGQRTYTEETKSINSNPPQTRVSVLDSRFGGDTETFVSSVPAVKSDVPVATRPSIISQNSGVNQYQSAQNFVARGSVVQRAQVVSSQPSQSFASRPVQTPVSQQTIGTRTSEANQRPSVQSTGNQQRLPSTAQAPSVQSTVSQSATTKSPIVATTQAYKSPQVQVTNAPVTQRPYVQTTNAPQYNRPNYQPIAQAAPQPVNVQSQRIPQGQYYNKAAYHNQYVNTRFQNDNSVVPVNSIGQSNAYLENLEAINRNIQQTNQLISEANRYYATLAQNQFNQIARLQNDYNQRAQQELQSRFGR